MKTRENLSMARGIALLMALVVVLLCTTYIGEFFLTSGLELRSLQTFRDSEEARSMARLAFKALQTGLMTDQGAVLQAIDSMGTAGGMLAIPWQGGFLSQLEIKPLDHLFNLNELHSPRPGTAPEIARAELFQKLVEKMELPPLEVGQEPTTVPPDLANSLYAALVDWIDPDETDFVGYKGGFGAEQSAYLSNDPELHIPNGKLDLLTEMRMVRGFAESRIPWKTWMAQFTVLPTTSRTNLYPGRINVNFASAEEIRTFVENRRLDIPGLLADANFQTIQNALNEYADHLDDILAVLIPDDGTPRNFTETTLKAALTKIDSAIKPNYYAELFTTKTEYFRVGLTADKNGVEARLVAILYLPGGKQGPSTSSSVLAYSLR